MEVACDPVAFALDRRVRPSHDPGAVLVSVLEELEQRADRLVGHARGRDVAHEQQPAGRVAGDLRRPRFEVDRLPFAMERALPGRGEAGEVLVGLDRGCDRRPRLALDEGLRKLHHPAERAVRSDDHVALIELDDAVHRRLEHGAQPFLGLAEGLVRELEARERLVGPLERALLLGERLGDRMLLLRASDLVDEDAQGDGGREHRDQERGLLHADLALDLLRRDEAEGAARGGHRERGEHGPAVPGRVHARLRRAPRDDVHQDREEQRGERDRQVDLGLAGRVGTVEPVRREHQDHVAERADRGEHPEVRGVRADERQCHERREAGRGDEGEARRGGRRGGVGSRGTQVEEQHRPDRGGQQGDVRCDLALVLPRQVGSELDGHGDEEQHGHDEERDLVRAQAGRDGTARLQDEEGQGDAGDAEDPEAEPGRAPPRVGQAAPEQDRSGCEEAGDGDEREPGRDPVLARIGHGDSRPSGEQQQRGRDPRSRSPGLGRHVEARFWPRFGRGSITRPGLSAGPVPRPDGGWSLVVSA